MSRVYRSCVTKVEILSIKLPSSEGTGVSNSENAVIGDWSSAIRRRRSATTNCLKPS